MNRKDDNVMTAPIIGVSPAYFISFYSDRFSVDQMVEGLEDVAKMGFTAFNPKPFIEVPSSTGSKTERPSWQDRSATLL
jgi:hypothetical protein